jgi:hypothetical protein
VFSVTRLLDVAAEKRTRVLDDLAAAAPATGARRWIVAPTLPGSRNGGDILVHLTFGSEDELRCALDDLESQLADPGVTRVNGANYPGGLRHTADPVYRILLLRVLPGADAASVARFERDLALMPRFIPAIRAWQLSHVREAVGDCEWTHVFEQRFSDVEGLMGPYLMHPIHWAVVDRWFDPECPEVIVRDRVCHSFCLDEPKAFGR